MYQYRELHREELGEKRKKKYLDNIDIERERSRRWGKEHPIKKRRSDKKWREANRESILKKKREYLKTDRGKEVSLKNSRLYAERHPKKRRATWTKYNKKNPEQMTHWRRENPEKSKALSAKLDAIRRGAEGEFSGDEWLELVSYYCPTGKCLCCRKKVKLTQDHVIAVTRGGSNYIYNIQPICGTCNSSKNNKTIEYRPDSGAMAKNIHAKYNSAPSG